MVDAFSLEGKVALVSGGSRGLGLAIARGLGDAGATVVLAARGEEGLANASKDFPGRVLTKRCDVCDERQVEELVAYVVDECGGLDILVNSAGVNLRGPSVEMPLENWDTVMNINLRALFLMSQRAARRMIERKTGGSIINISSLASEGGLPRRAPYAASKGGVKMLTRTLAGEWAQHGIRVNAIGPGYFLTEMTRCLGDDPEFDKWVKGRTPMGRWGRPEELAGCAVFLASDASSFVTGQSIYVDGGFISQL